MLSHGNLKLDKRQRTRQCYIIRRFGLEFLDSGFYFIGFIPFILFTDNVVKIFSRLGEFRVVEVWMVADG